MGGMSRKKWERRTKRIIKKEIKSDEQKGHLGMKHQKLLFQLFFSMLYISTFTFGGGFVIITFMKRKFVDELHWIDEQEMLDLAALAQSSPGAIAVNAAILVGWRTAGLAGMAAAFAATFFLNVNVVYIILAAALFGIGKEISQRRRKA